MGKRAYVYDGTNWVDIAQTATDMTGYADLANTRISGFRNAIINGSFDIWQRGPSFTGSLSGGTYTSDRWRYGGSGATAGTLTISRNALGVTELPLTEAGLTYYAKYAQTVAPSTSHDLAQRIENVRTFSGKNVTLSFYARLNSGTMPFSITLQQSLGTGGTGSPATVTTTITNSSGTTVTTATSSWARYYATFTVPSLSGMTIGTAGDDYLSIGFNMPASGTWNFDVTGIQLEEGTVATPFENIPVATELALCQRYFLRYTATANGTFGCGLPQATVTNTYSIAAPVPMRVQPVVVNTSGTIISYSAAGNQNLLTIAVIDQRANIITFSATVGTAQGGPLILYLVSGAVLDLSAEY